MHSSELAETGIIPDYFIRWGIRRLLHKRLIQLKHAGQAPAAFADDLRNSPLAVETDAANEQHYEVNAEFYRLVLGPQRKYSCCFFSSSDSTLADAEEEMLRLSCERAEIHDGMRILELGCGWGSLTLWMARNFPHAKILAVSNSESQRKSITLQTKVLGLDNVQVRKADVRELQLTEQFDRVVSIEMFEHMRNYELLFRKVADWLEPDGKAFVHVFCHRSTPYLFQNEGKDDWMARHFFTGGTMPSEDLFRHFATDLGVTEQWRVSGQHYHRTCECWLQNLDRNRSAILRLFRQDLTSRQARILLQRWRMFFMACAELFNYAQGNEWFVSQYLFEPVQMRQLNFVSAAGGC